MFVAQKGEFSNTGASRRRLMFIDGIHLLMGLGPDKGHADTLDQVLDHSRGISFLCIAIVDNPSALAFRNNPPGESL